MAYTKALVAAGRAMFESLPDPKGSWDSMTVEMQRRYCARAEAVINTFTRVANSEAKP
jgi:hypothetical protein